MEENKNWEYDVKCRKCGKITRMWHSTHERVSAQDFKIWALEHSAFPIQKQCYCDSGMMMFHDIVSFGNVLSLTTEKTANKCSTWDDLWQEFILDCEKSNKKIIEGSDFFFWLDFGFKAPERL
jgi:hypothetical protein